MDATADKQSESRYKYMLLKKRELQDAIAYFEVLQDHYYSTIQGGGLVNVRSSYRVRKFLLRQSNEVGAGLHRALRSTAV